MFAGTPKKKSTPGSISFAKYLGTSTQVLGRTGTVYWGTGTKLLNPFGYIRFFRLHQDNVREAGRYCTRVGTGIPVLIARFSVLY